MVFNNKDFDSKQRFGIRKLSVGVCSVLLSTLFLTMNDGQTVHADTTNANQAHDENSVTDETGGGGRNGLSDQMKHSPFKN